MKYPIYEVEKINTSWGGWQVRVLRGDLMKNPAIDKTNCWYSCKTETEADKKLKYYNKFIKLK